MDLLRFLAVFFCVGCVLSAPSDDKQNGESPNQINESGDQDHNTEPDKRLYGSVLSSGFKLGKKEAPTSDGPTRYDIKREFKKWYYGSILGKGFKSGKRYYDQEESGHNVVDDKRNLDSIDDDIEEVDLDGPMDDKRWVGDVFRGGYPSKRTRRDALDKRFIHYFGRGFVLRPRHRRDKSNGENSSDEKYYIDELGPYLEDDEYKEEDEDSDEEFNKDKRYFWTNPGYRFDFGKRYYGAPDESDPEYLPEEGFDSSSIEKRLFGSVLGRGYAFGKRRYLNAPRKRPFGYILGRGFSFGKRTDEDPIDKRSGGDGSNYYQSDHDEDLDMDKRVGWLLGRGFKLGKRGSKRFGWILGRGLKFGKRSSDAVPLQPEYYIDDNGHVEDINDQEAAKRFGHVLGSGFAFGKRDQWGDFDTIPDKRGFGFVLGRGFRLGKR